MNFIERYTRSHYDSMEDFEQHFSIQVPEHFNFAYDIVDEYARLSPNKCAMVWVNDEGEEHVFSSLDMKRLSDRCANVLRGLGLGKGDVIMTMLMQRYEFWILSLACHKLGVVLIPASNQLTTKDVLYRVEAANIRLIVSVNDPYCVASINHAAEQHPGILDYRMGVGASIPEGWLDFKTLVNEASPEFVPPTGADMPQNQDRMLMFFTSGTTGMPKAVVQDFTYPLGHIVTAAFWQNVEDDGLHLTVSDTGWAKCAWGKIYGQWIAGTALFVYDYKRFHAQDLCQKVCDYKVTTFCAPATVYRFMIKEDLSQFDFSNLHHACVAGEPLNPEVQSQFHRLTGCRLMEAYGQSETTPIAGTFTWMEPKPGSMGKPNPLYEVVLLSDDGQPVPVGEEGEVCIRTSNGKPVGLFNGYYNAPEVTQRAWHDGFYHTGDVAWKDEDGFLWFVGRADDVIKSSGYRIGPFEVESVLMEHPSVLECAITGYPDPVRGQAVKATIVLARGYTASDALKKELQDYVKHNTAPYKYPRVVEFVTELPKTTSGKVRRKDIVRRDMEAFRTQQQ